MNHSDALRPLALTYDTRSQRVVISECGHGLNAATILSRSHCSIMAALRRSPAAVHAHRLVYAVCGLLFFDGAPAPFGNTSASAPGFGVFCGKDADQLLAFVVSSAYKQYWAHGATNTLEAVAAAANNVLLCARKKDLVDEMLLQGMRKAGHIDWERAALVPPALRHVGLVEPLGEPVGFSSLRTHANFEVVSK
ncbi:hypothetical protein HDU98_007830 [Podochytrium sp. JEL0797]|nr:hypothetical protein HDU98_007830 [Podochytrium sp. JEL0797]